MAVRNPKRELFRVFTVNQNPDDRRTTLRQQLLRRAKGKWKTKRDLPAYTVLSQLNILNNFIYKKSPNLLQVLSDANGFAGRSK